MVQPQREDPFEGVSRLLDEGRHAEARRAALAAARATGDAALRTDLMLLAADAAWFEGDAVGAEQVLRHVVRDDPECAPAWGCLALLLFRMRRFEEAWVAVHAALGGDGTSAEAHVAQGLLLERRGDHAGADVCFTRAAELDPDRHPLPIRLTREQFDREVQQAVAMLPQEFRRHLEHVPLLVEDVPSDAVLEGVDEVADPELLGLFEGPSLADPDSDLGGSVPQVPRIRLFQRNLERFATSEDELVEQIRITIFHELGHYLGFDEEGLDALGLG
jgi:predicted Zn-dependent protease with MMP-like domain